MSMQSPGPSGPLASVVVACLDRPAATRRCVAALLRHTRRPWELIAVARPGGEAWAYLSGVRDAAAVPVTLLEAPASPHHPLLAAAHAGVIASRGAYIVLVRNTAVVTDAWLDQLAALAEMDGAIGLAGPMTVAAQPPQRAEVSLLAYGDIAGLDRFATTWRRARRGKWQQTDSLAGGCVLIKRRVLERPGGGLRVRPEGLRRPRLAARARRLGCTLAVAHDLYVHQDAPGGPAIADVYPPMTLVVEPGPRPRVSLTMIVRDEAHNLPACLGSVAGLFDEVIVVDTGSTDGTPEIARAHGARVFDFPWVDDFAAARNAALARATGDYAFWLDADDVLDPPHRERLRVLLTGLRAGDEAGYVVRCACDDGPGAGRTVVDHVRLFPRLEGVRWEYAVHEQILASLRRARVPVRWTDVEVRHTGYADPVVRARKLARDEAILRRELEGRPGDPFVLFNLGFLAVERQDWPTGLRDLGASLAASAPADSITAKLHALIARCHQGLGDAPAAIAACAEGRKAAPDDAELWFREAVVRRQAGDPGGAEACWRRVLGLRRPERFSSVDAGIYGHLTRRNLATLAEQRGDAAEAAGHWKAVLAECPGDAEATDHLAAPRTGADAPGAGGWLIPGSRREVVPAAGPGDFDPYLDAAEAWVVALEAQVVVELGVRAGSSTRALLRGVRQTGGRVWGVDPAGGHGIDDPAFTFVQAGAETCGAMWPAIDLLHIDTDPHTEAQTRAWLDLYAARCRALAFHDAHHPAFGVGRAVRAFVAAEPDGWSAYEYRGNPSGWTVLTRRGEPAPPPGPGLVGEAP